MQKFIVDRRNIWVLHDNVIKIKTYKDALEAFIVY